MDKQLQDILLKCISTGHIELGPLTRMVNKERKRLGKTQFSPATVSARIRDHLRGRYEKLYKYDKNGTRHCWYIAKDIRRAA